MLDRLLQCADVLLKGCSLGVEFAELQLQPLLLLVETRELSVHLWSPFELVELLAQLHVLFAKPSDRVIVVGKHSA